MNCAAFRGSLAAMDGRAIDRVFYDGHCGLCHGTVKFLVARDPEAHFRFAPLDGPTFAALAAEAGRSELPDSLVVVRADGAWLFRSEATVHVLERLGGVWRGLGRALGLVPTALRDAGYDLVARVRRRLFGTPSDACPQLPPELAARFDP